MSHRSTEFEVNRRAREREKSMRIWCDFRGSVKSQVRIWMFSKLSGSLEAWKSSYLREAGAGLKKIISVCVLSHIWLLATLWTVAHQTPLFMEFPGKNTGVGCHLLLQGIFLTQGSNHISCIGGQIVYNWATRETHKSLLVFFIFLKADLNFIDLFFVLFYIFLFHLFLPSSLWFLSSY